MNDPHTIPRKRKRGKNKHVLIEDDDDAIDIVTIKEVTIDTPIGPVKKLVEAPLRSIAGSQAGPSNQPQPVAASQTEGFDGAMSHIINDAPMHEASQNKVLEIYLWPLQSRNANRTY